VQFPIVVGGVVVVFNLPGIGAGQLRLTGDLLAARLAFADSLPYARVFPSGPFTVEIGEAAVVNVPEASVSVSYKRLLTNGFELRRALPLQPEARRLVSVGPDIYRREQRLLAYLEREAEVVWQEVTRPLYRQMHPSQHLESLYGVGEKSAAVYASYIGRAARFPTNRKFRGWHGLDPRSNG